MSIATGTLCYICGITRPANRHLLGRVCVVTGPAIPRSEHGGMAMHPIEADWIQREHPRVHFFAAPECLRPIAAPGKPPAKRRKREPEHA